jgi:hypothetical protein
VNGSMRRTPKNPSKTLTAILSGLPVQGVDKLVDSQAGVTNQVSQGAAFQGF